MSWLDKFKGKGGRPDGGDKPQGLDRGVGGTVVRPDDIKPAPTIAKPGIRFQPNHEVNADLQIKSLLGSGGMGEVYLARQRQWDADVAIKIPNEKILSDPENRHRIIREAKAWTDLGLHPNIAYCYYVQPLGELLLVVIEYVDGGNLLQWIADGRCADLKAGLDLAIQFCHGLEHAHGKDLVHRDIKPANILIMQDGTLKITDFGIVSNPGAVSGAPPVGAALPVEAGGTVAWIGTPEYIAPERYLNKFDLRVDIFALGVCMYEMFCGARPYPEKYATAGLRQEAPDPGRLRGQDLPKRLCRLMKQCVDWDPEQRPSGAQEVRAELCAVYEEQFGEPCVHAELPELTTQADDWNNRALSYLALGRDEDAEKAWETALKADPTHPESTYNFGLHRWRGAEITDQEIVTQMREVTEGQPDAWLPRFLLAQLHLERGEAEGAKAQLSKIVVSENNRPQIEAAWRAVHGLVLPTAFVRAVEGYGDQDFWRPAYGMPNPAMGARRSACLSADGRFALSGSPGNTLKLWDIKSGDLSRTFRGHFAPVTSVSMCTDGRFVFSGSADRTAKIWETASGRCIRTLEGHTAVVRSAVLSANGTRALSDDGKTIRLWDVESGRCLSAVDRKSCYDDYSPSVDLDSALSRSNDGLKIIDLESGRCLRSLETEIGYVFGIVQSADGRFALTNGVDRKVKLWDVATGNCLRTFRGDNYVSSVALGNDGRLVISGSRDGMLRIWEVQTERCLRTIQTDSRNLTSVSLSHDARYALSVGDDCLLKLWEIGTFQFQATLRLSHVSNAKQVIAEVARHRQALSKARTAFAKGDNAAAFRYVRRARQEPHHRRAALAVKEWTNLYTKLDRRGVTGAWMIWRSTSNSEHLQACLSANGRFALCADDEGLKLLEAEGGREVRLFEGRGVFSSATGVGMSSSGRNAISGSPNGTVKLWDVASGRCLRIFEGHQHIVWAVCLTSDERLAVSGCYDTLFKLWDLDSGRCLHTFAGHRNWVNSVCVSVDSRYALTASHDNTLMLWCLESRLRLRIFEGHALGVRSACLSADGRLALSGSCDRTLKLWDLDSGRCIRTLVGHNDDVVSVCLTPDGGFAFSGSKDKTVKLWDLSDGRCLLTLNQTNYVESVSASADGSCLLVSCSYGELTLYFLDWELEEKEPSNWDEGARPYIDVFFRAQQPCAGVLPSEREPTDHEVTQALSRRGKPKWTEPDFQRLLYTLGCAGYGWLRPDGVRRELERSLPGWIEQAARDETKARNLALWRQSGAPGKWVRAHHCHWNHEEWERLLAELATSEFWPMNPDRVGLVLEELKSNMKSPPA